MFNYFFFIILGATAAEYGRLCILCHEICRDTHYGTESNDLILHIFC